MPITFGRRPGRRSCSRIYSISRLTVFQSSEVREPSCADLGKNSMTRGSALSAANGSRSASHHGRSLSRAVSMMSGDEGFIDHESC